MRSPNIVFQKNCETFDNPSNSTQLDKISQKTKIKICISNKMKISSIIF